MKLQYRSNLTAGIVSVVMGAVLYYLIPLQISADMTPSNSGMTSQTLPSFIAILFILCGLGLLVQSLVFKQDEVKELEIKTELWTGLYMVCLVIYGCTFKQGFLPTTCVLAVATLAFARCKNKWYYVITVAAVFGLYFIFKTLLHVRLP